MKIMFVTSEIPYPPDNGVRIPSHYAMRLMSEAGHDIALAVLSDERDRVDDRMRVVRGICGSNPCEHHSLPARSRWNILAKAMLHRRLYFIERYRDESFRAKLRALIDTFQPDVIHFDLILMTQYRDCAPGGVRTIASINDSYALTLENTLGTYHGMQRLYRKRQLRVTKRFEAEFYPRFDTVHTMTSIDADYLRQLNPAIHTTVIPNGVDPALFGIQDQTIGRSDVIFVAKLIGYNLQNLELFLETGWPVVREACPDVKLHVVGGMGPETDFVQSLADRVGGVVFHGYVSSLSEAYSKCGISVVLAKKNCGIMNKAIEALAAGLVVVGFEQTFEGIPEVRIGEDAVIAKDHTDIGSVITKLVADEQVRRGIQTEAYALASEHYTWSSRLAAYEQMYQQAMLPSLS